MMRILADENMPLVREFFSGFGDVVTLPGRTLRAADLAAADVLLVRSVTEVNRQLLQGSQVRWVGSATIGTDHIDRAALVEQGITLASAPGCNARAVGEYVATVLARLAVEQGFPPESRRLGIIGLGNTGRAVAELAQALGFAVSAHDPAVTEAGVSLCSFEDLLADCDMLSFHVPLSRRGPHPTFHLMDAARLRDWRHGRVLINCSRGAVVDNQALLAILAGGRDLTTVLDVWEGEPRLDPLLLSHVRLGTPHVAGYSQEGKWRGTAMLYQQFCHFLGQPPSLSLSCVQPQLLPPPLRPDSTASVMAVVADVLEQACPVQNDDRALRLSVTAPEPAAAFDDLRKHYRARREFTAHRVELPASHPAWSLLQTLGFRPAIGVGLAGEEGPH